MLHVGSEHDLGNVGFGLACLDIAADQFELPAAFNPLADALEGGDILEERIRLRVIECEFDYQLLSRSQIALGVVALEVLRVFLKWQLII